MSTRVASVNLKFTLSAAAFEAGLREVLRDDPDLVAIQEAGINRNPILEKVGRDMGYSWARPKSPNGDPVMPVMWSTDRYRLRSCKPVTLARREFVGHLPGRKSRLPASIATEVMLDDLGVLGGVTTLIDYHLTAEVQVGAGYRKDAGHRLRVMRHKREKLRLGRRGRSHQRTGRRTFLAGDGNYSGMTLGGFVSCWQGRKGGTLGNRAVDIIFAATKAVRLWTVETASDHDALVVTYP